MEWEVPRHLFHQFCLKTRVLLEDALDAMEADQLDVQATRSLIYARNVTQIFEQNPQTFDPTISHCELLLSPDMLNFIESNPQEFHRTVGHSRRFRSSALNQMFLNSEKSRGEQNPWVLFHKAPMLSSVFEVAMMHIFKTMIKQTLDQDQREGNLKVFTCSSHLFTCFETIGALSEHQNPQQLSALYQEGLADYTELLCNKLPSDSPRKNQRNKQLTSEEKHELCVLASTCEYCAANSIRLQRSLRDFSSGDGDDIDFDSQQAGFCATGAKAVQVLVFDLEQAVRPVFIPLERLDWAAKGGVSEGSLYFSIQPHQWVVAHLPGAPANHGRVQGNVVNKSAVSTVCTYCAHVQAIS